MLTVPRRSGARWLLSATVLLLAMAGTPTLAAARQSHPDLDGDGRADLAVGVYREGISAPDGKQGAVDVLYGAIRARSASPISSEQLDQTVRFMHGDGAQVGDQLGWPLCSGDFDGDGRDDLAIGIPREAVRYEGKLIIDAGAVQVVYGGRRHVDRSRGMFLTQMSPLINGGPENFDRFGSALAAGDLNGDGRDELIVATTEEQSTESARYAGAVNVFRGTRRGLTKAKPLRLTASSRGLRGPGQSAGGLFGWSLASGDFTADGRDDLAIGTRESIRGSVRAGALHVIPGARRGLLRRGRSRYLNESKAGLRGPGVGEDHDFAYALTAGDFDGDGHADLAVGVPGAGEHAGAVRVLHGSRRGISLKRDRYLTPSAPGIDESRGTTASWGWTLDAGDLDADRRDDLVTGTPFGFDVADEVGGAHVFYGSRRGIGTRDNRALTQKTPGLDGDGVISRCDTFGRAVQIANLNGRGPEELIIGEPQDLCDGADSPGSGGVHVLYPSRDRDLLAGYRFITQDTPGLSGDGAEVGDGFGAAFATSGP